MKYHLPCAANRQTQGFGESPEIYSKLKNPTDGHPAYDFGFTWNEAVPFIARSFVYSKLNEGSKDPDKYTGLCTIAENPDGTIDEIIYGHGNLMVAEVGKTYEVGDTAILAGNRGMVFAGGRRITKDEKLKGSQAGTHLHLQKRPLKKVKKITKRKHYLETAGGKFKKDGFYYEILDFDNGFRGCAPIQFNGKIARKEAPKVSYEQAVEDLKKGGLTGYILVMALRVLARFHGR